MLSGAVAVEPAEAVPASRRKVPTRLVVTLGLTAIIVLAAVFAPVLFPQGYDTQNLLASLKPPSTAFLLGTDEFGRSELARIVWGARISLEVGFIAVMAGAVAGSVVGVLAGLYGGVFDTVISALADIIWSFPIVLLAIALVAILRPGVTSAIVAIAFGYWPQYARVVRADVLELRERTFVEAARAVGATRWRIAIVHMIPNVIGPVMILASLGVADAILTEATLSFLGLGAQPPLPDWGSMLADAQTYVFQAPWLSIVPGVAITFVVVLFNELGEVLSGILTPARQRS